MSFQTFFAGLDAEVKYMLGIATAAAPLIATGNPNAAATLAAVNEAVTIGGAAVDQIVAGAAASGVPLTQAQIAAHASELISAGLQQGAAMGAISADKANQIQAKINVISAIAAAAKAPVVA